MFMSEALSKCVTAVDTCNPKAMIATFAVFDEAGARARLRADVEPTGSATIDLQGGH